MKPNTWHRFRLYLDGLDRYHDGASMVLIAGGVGMVAASCLDLGPPWAGFLVGALLTFVLVVLVHPEDV
jgi:hypothetical protein